METKHIVELFCELDLSTYHPEIGESVMAASFEAVDCLAEVCCYYLTSPGTFEANLQL